MKVNIMGITPSTITLNTIGIIIRGDSNDLKKYPNSIAKNVEILDENQKKELDFLSSINLIKVENLEKKKTSKKTSTSKKTKNQRGRPKRSKIKRLSKVSDESKGSEDQVKMKEDSELSMEDRMGLDAIISTGDGNKKVKMKSNLIPEAEAIKERGVKFIDEDNIENTDYKDAFVESGSPEGEEPDFLEY